MNEAIDLAIRHWAYVAPVLRTPRSESDYDALMAMLDELLAITGDSEDHPLAGLVDRIGDLLASWDRDQHVMPEAEPREVLRFMMQEHGLSQSDLPEVGPQPVVSDILAGKRSLNARQVKALSQRFGLRAEAFL
jgi:HTH-type transcriptional regulator/antitoxin HigA